MTIKMGRHVSHKLQRKLDSQLGELDIMVRFVPHLVVWHDALGCQIMAIEGKQSTICAVSHTEFGAKGAVVEG